MIETFYELNGKDSFLSTMSGSSIGIFVPDPSCLLEYKRQQDIRERVQALDLERPGLKRHPGLSLWDAWL